MDTNQWSKGSVEAAIVSAFRRQFANLTFYGGHTFLEIDPDGTCSLTLQGSYHYKGDYTIEGTVFLGEKDEKSGNLTYTDYYLSGRVNVDEEDNFPKITFISPFSVRKLQA